MLKHVLPSDLELKFCYILSHYVLGILLYYLAKFLFFSTDPVLLMVPGSRNKMIVLIFSIHNVLLYINIAILKSVSWFKTVSIRYFVYDGQKERLQAQVKFQLWSILVAPMFSSSARRGKFCKVTRNVKNLQLTLLIPS